MFAEFLEKRVSDDSRAALLYSRFIPSITVNEVKNSYLNSFEFTHASLLVNIRQNRETEVDRSNVSNC
jgi:hypothetical protein